MINPFQKRNLKIATDKEHEKITQKPDIVTTFIHFFPDQPLKKSAKATMTLCPIHGERNASLALYPETNTYYCFACEATGDSFNFIMEIEKIDFQGAIAYAKDNNLL